MSDVPEMVERCSKAAWDRFNSEHRHGKLVSWADQREDVRDQWRDMQRAALAAMRAPTVAMTQAAADQHPNTDDRAEASYAIAIHDAAETWQAMIDAALGKPQ